MSHVVSVKVRINSLEALKAAARDCGLVFRQEQRTYRWYGRYMGDSPLPEGFSAADLGRCDHALAVKDDPFAYEVGVVKARDGKGWVLLYDFWAQGHGLEFAIGKNAERLAQRYAVHAATRNLARQGYRVVEQKQANGTVKLVASRG